jgi:hypothetical protein
MFIKIVILYLYFSKKKKKKKKKIYIYIYIYILFDGQKKCTEKYTDKSKKKLKNKNN